MPHVPAVRFKQREENFFICSALKECANESYRQVNISDYRNAHSGDH